MTTPAPYRFAPDSHGAKPLHLVSVETLAGWIETQPERVRAWLTATSFAAKAGEMALVPDPDGGLAASIVGHGTARDRGRCPPGIAARTLRVAPRP